MQYNIKYWYLASGMELDPDEFPTKAIDAFTKEEAAYKYWQYNNIFNDYTFEQFKELEEHVKYWGLKIEAL